MDHSGDIAHFTTVDQHPDPQFFVRFLDTGSTVADIQHIRQHMGAQLALHDELRVLDVGCGTGEALLPLAQQVGPRGQVVGVDRSATMIAEARRRHTATGLPVTFLVGDAHHLAFASATFDRCRTERTLLHLADPTQALAELVRVVRPGGHVVVFDFDWDMTFFDHPDKQLTRHLVQGCSDLVHQGWIGRQLPRLFRTVGLVEVASVPHVVHVPYAMVHALLDGLLAQLQEAGRVTAAALTQWWRPLDAAEAAGQWCCGQLGFLVRGRKP